MRRFTVANLLVLVGVIAVGMAAMKDGSEWTLRAAFTFMLAVLAVAVLGAIVRQGEPGWVGFSLFGCAYAAIAFCPAASGIYVTHMMSTLALDWSAEQLIQPPVEPKPLPFRTVINFGLNTGPSKEVDGELVPLTPAERKAYDEQSEARSRYERSTQERNIKVEIGRQIGDAFAALALGLVGAGVGRFLAGFRRTRHHENEPAVHTLNPIS